jgi:hypothetical protein
MQDMTALRVSHPSGDRAYVPVFWFTTLFAVVTYAAISARAVLSPYEVNYLIDARRLFSVAIGTLVLWLAIRSADRVSDHGPGAQIFAVLNVAIPGAIALLLAREAYDLVASGILAERFALNLRWMLTWIGYFAAAVASFLALGYYRQLQAATAPRSARVEDADMRSTPRAQAGYEVADIEFDPRASNQHH